MKGLIILANGFEETEAIATIDILRRANIDLLLTGVTSLEVMSAHDIKIYADKKLSEVDYESFDFLVIPGGKAVFDILDKSFEVSELIASFANFGKLIAAICAAPSQIGKLGYLEKREYTCFPGCNNSIIGGKYSPKKEVVIDGNFITAKAMGYTNEFALEIVEYLKGKNERKKIEDSIHGRI